MFWETFRTSSPAYFRLIHRIMCSMQHRIIIPLLQDLVWSLIKAMRPWRGCYSASPRLPYPKLLFNGPWKTPTPSQTTKNPRGPIDPNNDWPGAQMLLQVQTTWMAPHTSSMESLIVCIDNWHPAGSPAYQGLIPWSSPYTQPHQSTCHWGEEVWRCPLPGLSERLSLVDKGRTDSPIWMFFWKNSIRPLTNICFISFFLMNLSLK